jgi:hypothetical protein
MLNATSNVLSVLFKEAVNFKHYMAFVVDEWTSMELWCIDTDREKLT